MPEQLEKSLHDLLVHLYDPVYHPDTLLLTAVGCQPQDGIDVVRGTVIQAINSLRPGPEVPANARLRRMYQLLGDRYIHSRTQEETAERLGLTTRHLRREEQEAVLLLAQRLLESRPKAPAEHARLPEESQPLPESPAHANGALLDWRAQVQQEVASLQKNAPRHLADVAEAMQGAAELGRMLATQRGTELSVQNIAPGMAAVVHPSILRQVLVMAMGFLLEQMQGGQLVLSAERSGSQISIWVTAGVTATTTIPSVEPIQEILTTQGGHIETVAESGRMSLRLSLVPADQVNVLVVDDNLDMVYLYRRYAAGTRFVIEHLTDSRTLFGHIEAHPPDVIVLDIMLPDNDGWQLLTQLHEYPSTRSVPVVICSVIKGEQLALALGASLYLPKPVSRSDFIQAMERAAASARPQKQG